MDMLDSTAEHFVTNKACKRKRSNAQEHDTPVTHQRKLYINERVMNCRSAEKLQEIQKKTVNMLFKAARSPAAFMQRTETPQLITLTGNGDVQLRNFDNKGEVLVNPKKAECCDKPTLVQVRCNNCTLPLCEYCGYSCSDCAVFLCGTCVQLFGCGTTDQPICQNCAFFK